MPRVDVWDIPEDKPSEPIWIGYKQGFTDKYELRRKLGEGGFGSVRVVALKSSGAEFACKSICKRLDVPNLAPIKQQQHLENIKREVLILRKLRGTLNVVHMAAAYEDETHVHIVMEYCRGGELFHRMGHRHYSEQTVASYMRAVLRTLAQCHAHRILHRDVKPGNFMLLTEAEDSPLKAIDFGLAVFYDPAKLPRTDLGLEGTPWYMAPEVLSSCVEPASDVWAAGVMAYQLLSGRFPFDDWAHPEAPALSLVWRSILSETPSLKGSSWKEISQSAKDFCMQLLNKDPSSRPSALQALEHPWLQKGNTRQRLQGAQLTQVVQRLQRHSQQNVFKKTVLDMMANELLARHTARMQLDKQQPQQQDHQQQQQQQQRLQQSQPQQQQQQQHARLVSGQASEPQQLLESLQQSQSSQAQQAAGVPGRDASPEASPVAAAGGPAVRPPASPAAGIRAMPAGLPGAAGCSVVTRLYADGSVHRQQQLLRLVPPKRASSSLELSADEAAASKAARATGSGQGASQQGLQATLPGLLQDRSVRSTLAAAGARAEGTWHGPSAVGPGLAVAAAGVHSVAGGAEGSFHGRSVGSLRGATSALEALRRARERMAATSTAAAPPDSGTQAAAGSVAGACRAPYAALGGGPGRALPAGLEDVQPDNSYKGPVRDVSTASLWDLQFMANRLAVEGSAHGNAYMQSFLRAASTQTGRLPASSAALQAATAVPAATQQPPTPPQGVAASPQPAGAHPLLQQPGQPFGQQQMRPAVQAAQLQEQSLQWRERQMTGRCGPEAPAAPAAASRLEGTWHGPQRSSTSIDAGAASAAVQQSLVSDWLQRDLSWHGRTSHMQQLSEQEAHIGSKRASEREEFLRFLDAAKRQRQEQRKVARLVLEGSTHGGVQYFLPARSTCSVVLPAGPVSGAVASSLTEEADVGTDSDGDADVRTSSARLSTSGSRASLSSTPGSSNRGGSTAAAAGAVPTPGGGISSRPSKPGGLLGKLKHSLQQAISPSGTRRGQQDRAGGQSAVAGSTSGSYTDLNALARDSWQQGFAPDDPVPPQAQDGVPVPAGLPRPPAPSSRPQGATTGAAGGGEQTQLAEQILGLQSPGWQASLETRRRGQGAYAALMAATSMASSQVEPDATPAAPQPAPAAPEPAQLATGSTAAAGPAVSAPPELISVQAAVKLRPKAAPQHVGYGDTAAHQPRHPMLTPLEQALQSPTQQQQQQQQQAAKADMLLQPARQQLPLQPEPGPGSGLGWLPVPGQAQQHSQPQLHQQPASWQPPAQDSMLPQPQAQQQQQQQLPLPLSKAPAGPSQGSKTHHGEQASLLPQPGFSGSGASWLPARDGSTTVPAAAAAAAAAAVPAAAAPAAGLTSAGAEQAFTAQHLHSPQPTSGPPAPAALAAAAAVASAEPPPAQGHSHMLPLLGEVQQLLDLLSGSNNDLITVEQLQRGLASLGYLLEPSEVLELAQALGYGVENSEGVAVSQFAASQLDWEAIQVNHRDEWLQCLRATFDAMDADKDGRLKPSEILEALRDKLPEAEVNAAIEDVLLEAAADEDEGLDFAAFKLLASTFNSGLTPLDQYDARLGGSVRSQEQALQLLRTVVESDG